MRMRQRARKHQDHDPRVLRSVYGERLRSLHQLVFDLLGSYVALNEDDDPPEFRALLSKSYAALPAEAPSIGAFTLDQKWSQEEVVERVIELQFRHKERPAHVLCLGYQKPHPNARSSFPLLRSQNVQCVVRNSMVNVVTSHSWAILHSRIGDELMLYLLSHVAIFTELPNGCYMQVSGPQIALAAKGQAATKAPFCSFSTMQTKEAVHQEDKTQTSKKRKHGVVQKPRKKPKPKPTGDVVELNQSELPSLNEKLRRDEEIVEDVGTTRKRRRRPFKWQRMKKMKLAEASEADPSSTKDETLHSTSKHLVPAKLIDRAPMFYCTSFFSTTGLPPSHPLLKLKASAVDSATLFGLIFGRTVNHDSSRTPKSILKPLKRLIANARRFRCGHLLRRHCPLPGSDFKFTTTDLEDMFIDEGYTTQEEGDRNFKCICETSEEKRTEEPAILKNAQNASKPKELSELLTMFTPQNQVVDFVWACCRRLVPEELLGSQKNWRTLTKHIAAFVRLRRYEAFSSRQCLQGLKLSEFAIFKTDELKDAGDYQVSSSNTSAAGQMLESWMAWLFTNVVVTLLRMYFYVTESENQRQTVLFFRRPIWSKIQTLAVRGLTKTVYKRVDADGALKNRSLGFSKVRLLPKKSTVRPIANLGSASMYVVKRKIATSENTQISSFPSFSSSSRREEVAKIVQVSHRRKSADLSRDILRHGRVFSSSTFKPVNLALADAHQCLKYEQECHPGYLGASVFGYHDIYMKLVPFIQRVRSSSSRPPFFLVVCDVAKAFDTIKHERLLEVIFQFVHEQQYFVQRFSSVSCRLATVRVLHERACYPEGSLQNFSELASSLASKKPETVFVDQVSCSNVLKDQLLSILQEHVTKNLLHIGPHFFQQVTGIPQGSVLSSLLCALYYGYLDTTFIFPLLQGRFYFRPDQRHSARLGNAETSDAQDMGASEQSLLLRLVDDSLFISTSEAKASHFLNIMHTGLKEFGCFANPEKTATSFDMHFEDAQNRNLKKMYRTDDGACFMRWGGMLINCHTLETQADYTRYCGEHIKASLTVTRTQHQGQNLVKKMFQFMRPKCHPVFYDPIINSASTSCLNAYQALMICAMKFHAYVRALRPTSANNAEFFLEAIRTTTRYTFRLIKHRMRSAKATSHVSVSANEMEWLGLSAFRKVLARKQSTHKHLVVLIDKQLLLKEFKGFKAAPHLVSATTDARSSMFELIKY